MSIKDQVIKIIQSVLEDSSPLSGETQLSNLKLNSIEFINIVVNLEAEFNIDFEAEKLLFSEFPTIQSMIDYVQKRTEVEL